jgi:hypothetical protein
MKRWLLNAAKMPGIGVIRYGVILTELSLNGKNGIVLKKADRKFNGYQPRIIGCSCNFAWLKGDGVNIDLCISMNS